MNDHHWWSRRACAFAACSLTFLDQDTAMLGYTLLGFTQSKPISRQPF